VIRKDVKRVGQEEMRVLTSGELNLGIFLQTFWVSERGKETVVFFNIFLQVLFSFKNMH
jgi:hypothetical protein